MISVANIPTPVYDPETRYHALDLDNGREGYAKIRRDGTAIFFPGRSHYGMRCMATDLLIGDPEPPLPDEHFFLRDDPEEEVDVWREVAQSLLTIIRRTQETMGMLEGQA